MMCGTRSCQLPSLAARRSCVAVPARAQHDFAAFDDQPQLQPVRQLAQAQRFVFIDAAPDALARIEGEELVVVSPQ